MVGYALQNALLVRHARKLDGLSLAFYRNISFVITLAPLLIGAKWIDFYKVLSHWPLLLVAGISGGVYLALIFTAFRYVAAGITNAISRASLIILVTIFSMVFMQESLSAQTLLIIAMIVVSAICLGIQRNPMKHLDNKILLGVVIVVLASFPLAITKQIVTVISRDANPLVTGYFWELSIAMGAFAVIGLRWLIWHRGLTAVSRCQLIDIAGCSSFTLIGTGCLALAVSQGSLAIVESIGTGGLVLISLFAWNWYNERLRIGQWISILLIVAGIVGLKFVG